MIKKFPVAWMTAILALLSTSDAIVIYTRILKPDQAAWITAIVPLLTLVMGKFTHGAVTPLADPKTSTGRELVPAPSMTSLGGR